MLTALSNLLRDLDAITTNRPVLGSNDSGQWTKRVRDLCVSAISHDSLRPHLADQMPSDLHGRVEEAFKAVHAAVNPPEPGWAELVPGASTADQLSEPLENLRSALSEAAASSTQKYFWCVPRPDETDRKFAIAPADAYDRDLAVAAKEATSNQPLSALMIDLDHFKAINDTYGHDAGDSALHCVSEVLTAVMEGRGKAYRYGGDEFACLLPNTLLDEALATAERIRALIASQSYPEGFQTTVSIGVTSGWATEPSAIRQRADAALREAKTTRDGVRPYRENA